MQAHIPRLISSFVEIQITQRIQSIYIYLQGKLKSLNSTGGHITTEANEDPTVYTEKVKYENS